jgi:hypothetical protein
MAKRQGEDVKVKIWHVDDNILQSPNHGSTFAGPRKGQVMIC